MCLSAFAQVSPDPNVGPPPSAEKSTLSAYSDPDLFSYHANFGNTFSRHGRRRKNYSASVDKNILLDKFLIPLHISCSWTIDDHPIIHTLRLEVFSFPLSICLSPFLKRRRRRRLSLLYSLSPILPPPPFGSSPTFSSTASTRVLGATQDGSGGSSAPKSGRFGAREKNLVLCKKGYIIFIPN